ncbi:trem-like transcript 4 protein isoform X2 [Clupea harengus]|uniref:Trem-like transcript 4 protein isoform X2 n=1 Tax=Clupea harengus TaxID=7950 RepID=A0A6P8F5B1_CLUHA|nr:trem-like transcript 4 protein isoform X2 [Clupea harengus]
MRTLTIALSLITDPSYGKSIQINGHPGENSTVSCQYPDQMKKNLKYLYRRSDLSICSELITSESATDESKPSPYVMVDDKEGRFFNVTIRNMTLDDTGEYWCGVGTGTNTGSRNLLTVVKLHVIGK